MPRSSRPDAAHPWHIRATDLPRTDYSDSYPTEMMKGMRAQRIIGPGGDRA